MSKHSQQADFFQTPVEDIPSVNEKSMVFKLRGWTIPPFKNHKMILGIRKRSDGLWEGTPFIATKTEYRHVMEKGTRSLLLQFISASQTIGSETLTTQQRLFLICSLLPARDSWQWLSKTVITAELVPKGQEGVDITITKL